jgi:hypothetical protein
LEIYAELDEFGEEVEWVGAVVPLAEAYQRKMAHLPIVQKNFGPKRQFKFSISPGEVVECDGKAGNRELFVMRMTSQLSSGQLNIGFAPINDARKAREMQKARTWLWANPDTFRRRHPRKVAMNPLGELSAAND